MPGRPQRAILQAGPLRLVAALGRSGIATGKREGDGRTPRAAMKLLYGYWRPDRGSRPVTTLPMRPIRADDLWCDEPMHPAYNRPVRAPFSESHETMRREDRLYDICIVMDWNVSARKRGAGSAIFLHIARPGYQPTEGCVALSETDMRKLLQHVTSSTTLITG